MRLGTWIMVAVGCSDGDGGGDDTDVGEPPVTVTAYEELPIKSHFQWTDGEYEGGRITYYVPPDPRAVLFVFHGSEGDIDTVLQTEWLELYNLLEPEGFAFVLSQSLDRDAKQWDTDHTSTNPDFQRLSGIRDQLVADTALEASTPVFAAGFSNGGSFAVVFGEVALDEGWDVRAFLSHNASYPASGGVPGAYVSAENDESGGGPEHLDEVAEDCSEVVGVACPHFRGTEIPLDPRRFARLPQYSLEQSQTIFDELVSPLGYVDADGVRLASLDDVDALMNQYIAQSGAPIPSMPPTQLRVVWATHRFSSQHAREEVAFLLDRL